MKKVNVSEALKLVEESQNIFVIADISDEIKNPVWVEVTKDSISRALSIFDILGEKEDILINIYDSFSGRLYFGKKDK